MSPRRTRPFTSRLSKPRPSRSLLLESIFASDAAARREKYPLKQKFSPRLPLSKVPPSKLPSEKLPAAPIAKASIARRRSRGRNIINCVVRRNSFRKENRAASTVRPSIPPRADAVTGVSSAIFSVAFSPDGHSLASGGTNASAEIWDVSTGTRLRTLEPFPGFVASVAFSPDGRWLASGTSNHTIKLWDLATGQLARTSPSLRPRRLPGSAGKQFQDYLDAHPQTQPSSPRSPRPSNSPTGVKPEESGSTH